MSENQKQNNEAQQPEEGEINLLELLIVLVKNKKMILGVTFAAALLAVGFTLQKPNIYTATAKIIPPQQSQSSASALLSQLGGGALGGMAGMAGITNSNGLYIAMLKSRNITEQIASRFDLQTVYGTKTLPGTLKALEEVSVFAVGKDGVMTMEVDDKDPKLAADIANAYIEELSKLMQTFALTEAAQRRQYFESQIKPAKDKLTDAEITLDRTPNTSLKYMDAVRNLKYQEAIYEMMAKQFEMAKLDESKDAPFIRVLEKATVPEKKSKPNRSKSVILAALLAFFLAVILAFAREAMQRAKEQPEQAERLQKLRRAFRWRG